MSITVFADVLLPNSIIAAGVRGKNMRHNDRVERGSGIQSINVVWTQTIRQYEIGIVPLRVDQWQAIEALHEITEGGAYGMLMEDPKDNKVVAGVATYVEANVFQLVKRYTDERSSRTKDRRITRPREDGLTVFVSGVSVDFEVDVETGLVTLETDPDPELVTWSGRFLVPVHFMDDSIDWELVVAGAADARFLAGPSVMLQEVRE